MIEKLALVVATLQGGGAERVITGMANYWAERGVVVTLITLSGIEDDFYSVDGRVTRIGLAEVDASRNALFALSSNMKRVYRLRHTLLGLSPDLVISFLDTTNILALLATRLTNHKVIISERNDVVSKALHPAWKLMRKLLYRRAAAIVVQTQSQRALMTALLGTGERTHAIANPLLGSIEKAAPRFDVTPHRNNGVKVIVGMGRLEQQKGFDLLLQAFASVNEKCPEWRLFIFGEGGQRAALEHQVRALGLSEKVFLPGQIANTDEVLIWADIFILSSRFEGFPNALLEAMANGAAVIAFDCASGPADIIANGVDGLLVPAGDVKALGSTLLALIQDGQLRERLSQEAVKVQFRYAQDRVMGEWERLMESMMAPAGTAS